MADVKCPSCGKPNPESLEICQFCGMLLKQTGTEPLAPLLPGQFPEKKATSELERTLPGWLRDARRAANEPVTSPIPQPRVSQEPPSAASTPPPPKKPESPLDLLAGLSQAGEEEDDVPEWLQSLQGQTSPPAPAAPQSGDSQDIPDWLAALQEEPAQAQPAPQAEVWGFSGEVAGFTFDESQETAQSFGDTPDWLSGLESSAPSAPSSVPSAPESAPESVSSDLPDWLSGLESSAPSVPSAPSSVPSAPSSVPESASPLPPLSAAKPFSTGALGEFKSLIESEPVPDFLSGLMPETEPKKPQAEPEFQPGDLPDWLAGLSAGAASFQAEPGPSAETGKPAEMEGGMFALPELKVDSLPPAPVSANESIDSLLLDVPDWLSGFTPSVEPEQSAAAPDETELRPVELPSWVQAMRPVESMLTGAESAEVEEGEVEQQGPLAGLRSVLPVSAETLEIRKPQVYALKLQVGESQRAQAALLENLLASETQSKPVVPPEKVPLLRSLRWILFVVLTLPVLLPAVLGSRVLPAPSLPADPGAPFNQFYNALANAPESALVLVVTDYQPGFAGEMEQAAVPVITHLMRKNAQIAFLSTSPVSIEMGERLLQKARAFYAKNGQQSPSYLPGEQYLFLGYLPGGAAGVKAFSEQPQRFTGVDSVSGDLWQKDMLRDKMTDISGFDVILVITDDPDNGRLWIEQSAARRGSTPLLMVASAQAGPMIQPYAASGQLRGLVVGLEGGALYEQRDAQPGQPYPGHVKALYWDGFGAALVVALLAIFFGVLWSVVERLRARKNETEQDEA